MEIKVRILPDGTPGERTAPENKRCQADGIRCENGSCNVDSVPGSSAPTADFRILSDGGACLLRWPRNTRTAILPETLEGHTLTEISPLAFASFHFPEEVWERFCGSQAGSFTVFCIMNAGRMTREEDDEGGPVEIHVPDSVVKIGAYAFWHCDRLKRVRLSDRVTALGQGIFGACSSLVCVKLPEELEEIGVFFPDTVQAMPDVGTFFGCHSLKHLVLPSTVTAIGAEVFNSCGLEELIVEDDAVLQQDMPRGYQSQRTGEVCSPEQERAAKVCEEKCCFEAGRWSREIRVERSVFGHAAALQWMARRVDGTVVWQIGLAVGRDKILSCDRRYHIISQLPILFFERTPEEIDEMVKKAFRLDASGRMAIARLRYPQFLQEGMRSWYRDILIEYFDRLEQFWPAGEEQAEAAFALIRDSEGFDARMLGRLMYIAGRAQMKMELIYEMMEYRNTKFADITGLESLML